MCMYNRTRGTAKFPPCQMFPLFSLTDSLAPGKSGIAAGWKALRAFSDAPRQAHVIPCKRKANILQSARHLPEARIVRCRSRHHSIKIFKGWAAKLIPSSPTRIRRAVQLLVTYGLQVEKSVQCKKQKKYKKNGCQTWCTSQAFKLWHHRTISLWASRCDVIHDT